MLQQTAWLLIPLLAAVHSQNVSFKYLVGDSGWFASRNYPNIRPGMDSAGWAIQLNSTGSILVHFETEDFPEFCDTLRVYDNNKSIPLSCRKRIYESETNYLSMVLRFREPDFVGFNATWTVKPDVLQPQNKKCDAEDADCKNIVFTGTGLLAQHSYSCLVSELEISSSGTIQEGEEYAIPATYESPGQLVCSLNSSARVRLIGSFGKIDFGNVSSEVTLLISSFSCLDCQIESNSCSITENKCLVNGECFDGYAVVSATEMCVPEENTSALSPIPAFIVKDKVVVDTCGQVDNPDIQLDEVNGGYSLPSKTLVLLSPNIAIQFFARLTTPIEEERVILNIEPGISVYQTPGDIVKFELRFIDPSNGDEQPPVFAEIKLKSKGSPSKPKSISAWFAFDFDPESGEASFFYEGKKVETDLGDLSGKQLLTDGEFFINSDDFACVEISKEHLQVHKNGKKLRDKKSGGCEPIVKQNKKGKKACQN